jgi:methylated-DNA-protein-cysteine methyltransferase-like protein
MPSTPRVAADTPSRGDDADHVRKLFQAIYAVVRRIPRGKVATYGQVALLAGLPRGARVAGRALQASSRVDRLPWQRVIGKRGTASGKISIHDPIGAAVQRQLLEAEGVVVSDAGSISLARHGWQPDVVLRVRGSGTKKPAPSRRVASAPARKPASRTRRR